MTEEDLRTLERPKLPAVKKLRDSHHAVAKLVALGLRPEEVAYHSGYSVGSVRLFMSDPAFQGLVEDYRGQGDDTYREVTAKYYSDLVKDRNTTLRVTSDKLQDLEPDDINWKDLIALNTFFADRTGYGKQSTVDHKVDLSEALKRAIDASNKVLEAKVVNVGNGEWGTVSGEPGTS